MPQHPESPSFAEALIGVLQRGYVVVLSGSVPDIEPEVVANLKSRGWPILTVPVRDGSNSPRSGFALHQDLVPPWYYTHEQKTTVIEMSELATLS